MVLTWGQFTGEASRLHVKQEERRGKEGKMRSPPSDETLDVATHLRLPHVAASRARLRDKFVPGFHFS